MNLFRDAERREMRDLFFFFPPTSFRVMLTSHVSSLPPPDWLLLFRSQVCWVSSPSPCGAPDRASSTPPRLTSLDLPTTAARRSTRSRFVSVRSCLITPFLFLFFRTSVVVTKPRFKVSPRRLLWKAKRESWWIVHKPLVHMFTHTQ